MQHEDLPIDLLFRYKQYGLFDEEEEVKLEVFEVTRDNGNLIAKIHDEIKKTFEKISYNLVEGFTLLNKWQYYLSNWYHTFCLPYLRVISK